MPVGVEATETIEEKLRIGLQVVSVSEKLLTQKTRKFCVLHSKVLPTSEHFSFEDVRLVPLRAFSPNECVICSQIPSEKEI